MELRDARRKLDVGRRLPDRVSLNLPYNLRNVDQRANEQSRCAVCQ